MAIRKLPDEEAYKTHKNICRSLKLNVDEHIRSLLFTRHTGAVITPNRFPYRLYGDYKHYLLWVNPRYEKFWTSARIHVMVTRFLRNKKLFLLEMPFRNEEENQSINTIKHWHLLCGRV